MEPFSDSALHGPARRNPGQEADRVLRSQPRRDVLPPARCGPGADRVTLSAFLHADEPCRPDALAPLLLPERKDCLMTQSGDTTQGGNGIPAGSAAMSGEPPEAPLAGEAEPNVVRIECAYVLKEELG